MNNKLRELFLLVGVLGGVFAALCAYLITYNEYAHHFPDAKQPTKMAVQAAFITYGLFLVFFWIAGNLLSYTLQ